jgi:hypothetical protein
MRIIHVSTCMAYMHGSKLLVYSLQHATTVILPVSHSVQISAGKEDEAARVTARSRSDTGMLYSSCNTIYSQILGFVHCCV